MSPVLRLPTGRSAAILVLACAALGAPLLVSPGLPLAVFSDTGFHYVATEGFAQALSEGVWRPQWVTAVNHGFGGPVFLFYPPLAHAAAGVLTHLTGQVGLALELATVVFSLLAGLAFFACARARSSESAALLGSLLYLAMPYRVIDVYQRLALAEVAAFLWVPLIFHFGLRLLEAPRRNDGLAFALAVAGLVLTHLVTAYTCALGLALVVGLQVVRLRSLHGVAQLGLYGLLGLGLAGFQWIPTVLERSLTHTELMVGGHYDWARSFLFQDEVAKGYDRAPIKPWMRWAALAQLLLAGCAFAWATRGPRERGRPDPALLFGALALFAFVIQTALSTPLWHIVPELPTVQFPWRFSGLLGYAACTLVVLAWDRHPPRAGESRLAWGATAVAAGLWLVVSGASMVNANQGHSQGWTSGPVVLEYLPQELREPRRFKQRWRRALRTGAPAADRAILAEGSATVEAWESHHRRIRTRSASPGVLHLRAFAYPGWRAFVDGEEVPLVASPPNHTLALRLASGEHEVELVFGATPERRLAQATSAVALGVWLVLLWGGRSRGAAGPDPRQRST